LAAIMIWEGERGLGWKAGRGLCLPWAERRRVGWNGVALWEVLTVIVS
jgi:hypothetical protein